MTIVVQTSVSDPSVTGMTFLQLVNSLFELADISNTPLTTVQSVTGVNLRAKNWIKQAWIDIQNLHDDWLFLRSDFSFVSSTSQSYATTTIGDTSLRKYDMESVRMYLTASGVDDEQYLIPQDWEAFRNVYLYGARQSGRPNSFAVDPATKTLYFNSIPGTGYTTAGYYWTKPIALSADADVPACPSEYHMAIVYRAMLKYAGFESAAEAKQEAIENYASLMSALSQDQLPAILMAGSM